MLPINNRVGINRTAPITPVAQAAAALETDMTGAALGHLVYRDMPTTIFEQMSALARKTGAINLGQGFPDTPGPADILNVATDALLSRSNQ